MQDEGSKLRKKYGYEILSKCVATKIAITRESNTTVTDSDGSNNGAVRDDVPQKFVYLVDQLKHPDEVEFLRIVYRNLFYLDRGSVI